MSDAGHDRIARRRLILLLLRRGDIGEELLRESRASAGPTGAGRESEAAAGEAPADASEPRPEIR